MADDIRLKQEIDLLNNRLDDYNQLFKVLQTINSRLDTGEILQKIINEAVRLCFADHGSIILFDPDTKEIARTLIRSGDSEPVKPDSYLDNLLAGWVYEHNTYLNSNSLVYTFTEELIREEYQDIPAVLSVPIGSGKEMLGVINLLSLNSNNLFDQREINLMEILAGQCVNIISNANIHASLIHETSRLRRQLQKEHIFPEIIGKNDKFQQVLKLLERVIPTDACVLIEGESGTGKELMARILHYNGPQKEGPFVTVDCGAFPEKLLERELFGYVKGAFTGATQDKAGLFEEAHNGTLFLDEITNMPTNIQSKLLKALQEGGIRPVGSTKTKKVDVRIVAAASNNLKAKMHDGSFREDLYYKLCVIPVSLPPLREREGDILLLVNHFIKKYSEKYNKSVMGLKNETLTLMERYSWPGNILELENVIERMVILAEANSDYISPDLLPENIRERTHTVKSDTPEETAPLVETRHIEKQKADYEKDIILEALNKNRWNQSVAAQELGIHESTLRYRMRKFGIRKP